jgi:hypothetical protein
MNTAGNASLYMLGGVSGIVGTVSYVAAISVSPGVMGTYILAMTWPILSIVFIYALYRFIGTENQSAANQLAFLFGCLAFTLVAGMISIQLAVRIGIGEYMATSPAGQSELLEVSKRAVRLVDMGLDVAWDLFIGTTLIFLSVSLGGHDRFGRRWGIPAALLGAALIVLNVVTFPWPPDTRQLFDIGPAVGLFIIGLSIRLLQLGRQTKTASAIPRNADAHRALDGSPGNH